MLAADQQQAGGVAQLQMEIQIGAVLKFFGLGTQLPLTNGVSIRARPSKLPLTDVYVAGPPLELPLTGSCARHVATSGVRDTSLP